MALGVKGEGGGGTGYVGLEIHAVELGLHVTLRGTPTARLRREVMGPGICCRTVMKKRICGGVECRERSVKSGCALGFGENQEA